MALMKVGARWFELEELYTVDENGYCDYHLMTFISVENGYCGYFAPGRKLLVTIDNATIIL